MTGTDGMLVMWIGMMDAMMLPSLVPMLWRYRQGSRRMAIVGAGYLFVWTVIGVATYPLSVALTGIETRQPLAAGVIVVIAGALQFTKWKAHRLAGRHQAKYHGSAWRHGMALAVRGAQCCANLMVIMLVLGVMNFLAMAAVTAAITIEQLVPRQGLTSYPRLGSFR